MYLKLAYLYLSACLALVMPVPVTVHLVLARSLIIIAVYSNSEPRKYEDISHRRLRKDKSELNRIQIDLTAAFTLDLLHMFYLKRKLIHSPVMY